MNHSVRLAAWSIEVLFRASKQVLALEAPQHWSPGGVEKLAPWVWSMQSVIMVWYLTAGYESAERTELRGLMGSGTVNGRCVTWFQCYVGRS